MTTALQSYLAASPAGSVVCLAPGGTYRIGGQIHLTGRTGLTIEGNGARIYQTIRTNSPILLLDQAGGGYVLRNLVVQGSNPTPGKWVYAYEHNHGIAVGGVVGLELDHVTVLNVGGDGLYLGGGANRWADDVWVHDSTFDGIGRMGVAFTDGISNATVERSIFRRIGYYTWDIEPNGVQVGGRLAGAEHVRLLDNAIGPKPYGDYPADPTQADGFAFVTTGASGGGACSDVEVARNTVSDPNPIYAAFRWNSFLACQGLSVHDNTRQVKW